MSTAFAHSGRTRLRRKAQDQRGVAAIEFALVFVVLFGVLYGLATFGAVLYIQQTVTRASEEGARAVGLLTPAPTSNDPEVKNAVYDALANSLVVPASANASVASRRNWIVSNVTVDVTRSTPSGPGAYVRYVVTVTYPYSANRLLPTMPLLDASRWMPDQLQSRTTAALRSS
ncbi:TadE/TadG family type IV pilus assembly protein [Variovorax sp. IB41]|uniref:TadE/TadG family type IV pilus assembly protein n=1 Tax=Variovorax sp. IB41 TaxID=2779370 RepID=UPI0018E88BEE|nr:TadE/TadG family type IV pilus assembly protein [Variovorax sp. IB41]MBJ2157084.1 pilus assembly protein [Variovorax sp. IB41]